MQTIEIKKAELNDHDLLQKIARQTFLETFTLGNSAENLKKYVEEGFTKEKLTAELLNPNSEFYFALADNEVIGYLKLNTGAAQTELKDDNALEIERIYYRQKSL